MLHAAALLLMIGSAITAAVCCLVAGGVVPRAVPWQARQSAVVMALGMVALCAGDGDARILLLVAVAGIASAMLGVVGTRGRAHADACFHRALGCVVMAVCALAMLGARSGAPAPVTSGFGHSGHGALVPMSVAAASGVVVLLGLMLVARVRHRVEAAPAGGAGAAVLRRGALRARILLEAEGVSMAISLIVMAAMVLIP
ncbi:hypothetical protein ACIPY5_05810 [Microbacterium sp. NPDC089698]|uniref:hypothetical protein n=1 Tax=Microbacterium sp. NPDC089698 TaxID=3364200 RepID=UPI003806052C